MSIRFPLSILLSLPLALLCSACSTSSSKPLGPSLQNVAELQPVGGKSSVGQQLEAPVVMLHFLASWCTLCSYELPHLIALRRSISEEDLGIVAIAVDDTPEAATEMASRIQLPFPVLIDTQGTTKELFVLSDLPTTILLTPQGARVEVRDPKTGDVTNRFVGAYTWDRGDILAALKTRLAIKP